MAASAVIGALRVNLGIDSAAFNAGLSQAETRLGAFGRSLGPAVAKVAAFGAAAAAAGAAVVTALVKSSLDAIDAQSKLAQRVGGSVAAIQALEHAANLAGISSEDLTSAADRLNRTLGDVARTGKGEAFDALKRLGLTAAELSKLDVDERLATLADRMQAAGYSASQTADALKALGIKQAELSNLVQGGGGAIRDARKEIERYGIAVSDLDARNIEAANDALTRTGLALQGVGNQIAVALAPYIEDLANKFTETSAAGTNASVAIAGGFKGLILFVGEFANRVRTTTKEFIGLQLAGAQVAQFMRSLPGGDPKLLAEANKWVDDARKHLDELNKEPLPTDTIDQWFKDISLNQQKAAAKIELTRELLKMEGGGEGKPSKPPGPTTAEIDEGKKLAERLDRLRDAVNNEREAELKSYAERLKDLDEFYKAGAISTQQAADLRAQIERDHHDKMAELDRQAAEKRLQIYSGYADSFAGILESLSGIIGSEGKKQFEISKALSIASATIKGLEAVVSSYAAGARIGGPVLGAVFAAAAAAATAAQIAMISRQQFNGGGGGAAAVAGAGSAAGAAGGAAAPAAAQQPAMYLSIHGQQFGRAQVEELARQIIDFQRDGGRVLLAK